MRINLSLLPTKFLAGVLAGAVLFSGSAVAYNSYISDNTPEGGYLLCANTKTKAVTFPNKLSCPSGTTPLDMGAISLVEGGEGPQGPQGPQGPAGGSSTSTLWGYRIQTKDVVAPTGNATKFADLKKVILASISSANLQGGGNYIIRAAVTGLWGSGAKSNSFIKCYFQSATEYPSGTNLIGADSTEYSNWSGIDLTVFGEPSDYSLSQGNLYLVCATDGNISGLGGFISATSAQKSQGMGLSAPPNS
jgi:hypothetical protein